MKRRLFAALSFATSLLSPSLAGGEENITQGILIWRDDSCFFFVLQPPEGFGLYEFLGGPSPRSAMF